MRRNIAVVVATALIAASSDDAPLHGATLDFADDPVSVAVDADGDVLVGLRTDVNSGVVRRFSATGELRSATAWSGALTALPFVAEGPESTVFVAESESDEIAVVDAKGEVKWRWKVPGFSDTAGAVGGLISGSVAEEEFYVFARVHTADGHRLVQYRVNGRDWGGFSIGPSAYDVAVGRLEDGDVRAFVVRPGVLGGTARIVAYRLDGTIDGALHRDVDGDVLGIDTTPAGAVRIIVRPELSPTAHLDARNGPLIDGDPSDLAVAPSGDLFVVSQLIAHDPGVVLHYTAAGCLVETWPSELLNGLPKAAPTPGPSPCPGRDGTPTPDNRPSATVEASATHAPTLPVTQTSQPSPPPSPTPSADPNRRAFLPLALRDAVVADGTAEEDHGPIVLQVQDGGGRPSPPFFQMQIEKAPWFTLYADGTYVRSRVEHPFGWRVGAVSAGSTRAIVARLLEDEMIFPQLLQLCGGVCGCQTDGSDTRVLMRDGDRQVRTRAYLLSWLGRTERCRPIDPRPTAVAGDRILAFAQAVAALDAAHDPNERSRILGHFTVFAEPSDSTWRAAIPWPLDRPIRDAVGRDTLAEAELVRLVEAAESAGEDFAWSRALPFDDATGRWDVGLRAEPPGWTQYCEGERNCPQP